MWHRLYIQNGCNRIYHRDTACLMYVNVHTLCKGDNRDDDDDDDDNNNNNVLLSVPLSFWLTYDIHGSKHILLWLTNQFYIQ